MQYSRFTRVRRALLTIGIGLLIAIAFSLLPALENKVISEQAFAQGIGEPAHTVFVPLVVQNSVSFSPLPAPPVEKNWLTYLNSYRSMANLPIFTDVASWSDDAWKHSRYMVKNNIIAHDEDPALPYFTPEGQTAARSSNLVVSHNYGADDKFAIDAWMQAPFHAVSILDPALLSVGYGSYREEKPGFQMGATLDVLRGLGQIPGTVRYPIFWPGDGASVPIGHHWGEYPSPLASCPGYTVPSGLPVIMQIGPGNVTPSVTGHSFKKDGVEIEHCVFDETNYTNSDAGEQSLGRAVLDARDAIIIIPRNPLTAGSIYTVSIKVNGQTYSWSFQVSLAAQSMMELGDWPK